MAKKDFIENIHYYLENGKVIMTEKYLIEKGPCCGNNCRNCPYEPRAVKGGIKIKEKDNE
jgi:hypothetical protein